MKMGIVTWVFLGVLIVGAGVTAGGGAFLLFLGPRLSLDVLGGAVMWLVYGTGAMIVGFAGLSLRVWLVGYVEPLPEPIKAKKEMK